MFFFWVVIFKFDRLSTVSSLFVAEEKESLRIFNSFQASRLEFLVNRLVVSKRFSIILASDFCLQ